MKHPKCTHWGSLSDYTLRACATFNSGRTSAGQVLQVLFFFGTAASLIRAKSRWRCFLCFAHEQPPRWYLTDHLRSAIFLVHQLLLN